MYYSLCYPKYEALYGEVKFDTRRLIFNGINIYPKEYIWCLDSKISKSWATFLTTYYFTHSYFEDYPVYGLNNFQIVEYLNWKRPNKKVKISQIEPYNVELNLSKEKLEFTKGDYYEFYEYTRDSIVRKIFCQDINEDYYCLFDNSYDEKFDPPRIKWNNKILWDIEEIESLQHHNILTKENLIRNSKINSSIRLIDYYHGIENNQVQYRDILIGLNVVRVNYDSLSPIVDKEYLKDKTQADFSELHPAQMHAYYYWKKRAYPKKDVFDGFVPYFRANHDQEDDMEKLQKGTLDYSFYHFKLSIPTIRIEVID